MLQRGFATAFQKYFYNVQYARMPMVGCHVRPMASSSRLGVDCGKDYWTRITPPNSEAKMGAALHSEATAGMGRSEHLINTAEMLLHHDGTTEKTMQEDGKEKCELIFRKDPSERSPLDRQQLPNRMQAPRTKEERMNERWAQMRKSRSEAVPRSGKPLRYDQFRYKPVNTSRNFNNEPIRRGYVATDPNEAHLEQAQAQKVKSGDSKKTKAKVVVEENTPHSNIMKTARSVPVTEVERTSRTTPARRVKCARRTSPSIDLSDGLMPPQAKRAKRSFEKKQETRDWRLMIQPQVPAHKMLARPAIDPAEIETWSIPSERRKKAVRVLRRLQVANRAKGLPPILTRSMKKSSTVDDESDQLNRKTVRRSLRRPDYSQPSEYELEKDKGGVARYDDLYYKPTNLRERKYSQTWVEFDDPKVVAKNSFEKLKI